MPTNRESRDRYTADSTRPTTVLSERGGSRQSTSRYSSTVRSAPSLPPLTQANLQKQARLLEAERRRAYKEWEQEQSQRTLRPPQQQSQPTSQRPSQQQSRQSTQRPSQQSTSRLYAPLTSVLPPKPTAEDLSSGGFTYAYSSKGQDVYERYTEATSGSKVIRVKDTVAIPSLKRYVENQQSPLRR